MLVIMRVALSLLCNKLVNHIVLFFFQAGTASMPPPAVYSMLAMQAEIRTLEFWRSIIAECIGTLLI